MTGLICQNGSTRTSASCALARAGRATRDAMTSGKRSDAAGVRRIATRRDEPASAITASQGSAVGTATPFALFLVLA